MRQNKHVSPTRHAGTPAQGSNSDQANMPANNTGTMPVKLGAGKQTSIIKNSNGKAAGQASTISSAKANVPTSNFVNTNHKLGNTMHGVGEVPAYLRGKQG
jgi:hypothetical protein